MISLTIGVLSLTFAATMTYFVTREEGQDEPEPSLVWAVPPVYSLYLLMVAVNALTWSLVFVYARAWGAVLIASFLAYSLGAAFLLTRASLRK